MARVNDPSTSQSLKALEEKFGVGMVVLAFLGRYWGRVLGVLCAAFVCGEGYSQFQAVQKGLADQTEAIRAQNEHIDRQEGHLQAIDANIVKIEDSQAKADARWEAIHAAADIVVAPHKR